MMGEFLTHYRQLSQLEKLLSLKWAHIDANAWNRGMETILDLLIENPSIPRHYDA